MAKQSESLKQLASWMAGEFSSRYQAQRSKEHGDIRLIVYPIMKDHPDGFWFYVEQAETGSLATPYRQRVYHLRQLDDQLFENEVFLIKDPECYVVGIGNPGEILTDITAEKITATSGCSLILRRLNEEAFAGSTLGEGCRNERDGAFYTTSQLVINEHEMVSWDRGFDRLGKQIWGATMGGYVFRKQKVFQI